MTAFLFGHGSGNDGGRDGFRPRAWMLVAAGIVVARALLPWIMARLYNPNEMASVTAMYRQIWDTDYLCGISALARGEHGEFSIHERLGEGIHNSQPMLLGVFSLFFRFGGVAGLAAADVALGLLFFFSMTRFLRFLEISKGMAVTASLLVCLEFFGAIMGVLKRAVPGFPLAIGSQGLKIWGWRLPRPLWTELFFLGCLACMIAVANRERSRNSWGVWILLGVFSSLVLQTNPFLAFAVAFAMPLLFSWILAGDIAHWRRYAARFAVSAAVGLLASLPFFTSRSQDNPEFLKCIGMFPLDRFSAFPLLATGELAAPFLAHLAVFAAVLGIRRRLDVSPGQLRAAAVMMLLTTTAYLALPLSVACMGQTLLIHSFVVTTWLCASYGVGYCALIMAGRPGVLLPEKSARIAGLAVAAACVAGAATYSLLKERFEASNPRHCRLFGEEEWRDLTAYRRDFSDLARELSRPVYDDCQVLATLDNQWHDWWVAFRERCSYLGTYFSSTISQEEKERRVLALFLRLGMSREEVATELRKPYLLDYWIAGNRYQACRIYQASTPDDFRPEDRERIARAGWYDNWNLALPVSEERRLLATWDALRHDGLPEYRLDLILLEKTPGKIHLHPGADFELVYENASFRVWKRNP